MSNLYSALFGWLTAKPSIHTIIGAVGGISLGVYQLTQGNYDVGLAALAAGWAALGIGTHHAVSTQPEIKQPATPAPVAEVPSK